MFGVNGLFATAIALAVRPHGKIFWWKEWN